MRPRPGDREPARQELEARYLTAESLAGERGPDLLRYLLRRGADELSIAVMALQDTQAPFVDAFEDAMAPSERPLAARRMPTSSGSSAAIRTVRLWELTADSLGRLVGFLDDDLFTCPAGPDGWLEDLAVFRSGELVLGLVSHEREGVIRLTPSEHAEVARLGISSAPTGDSVRW